MFHICERTNCKWGCRNTIRYAKVTENFLWYNPVVVQVSTDRFDATHRHQSADWHRRERPYCGVARLCFAVFLSLSSNFAIIKWKEQRASMKSCFLLGKTAAGSVLMFQTACKDTVMSKMQVYARFSRFRKGHFSLECQLHSDNRRPPDRIKTSRRFMSWSWRTMIGQLTILLI